MSPLLEFTNHVSLYFGDGRVFFIGCLLSLVGVILRLQFKSKWRRVFDYSAWLGMLLVIISATPLPWWMYAVWLCAFAAAATGARLPKYKLQPKITVSCFAALTLLFATLEGRYRSIPEIEIPADQAVYILGDSISAGIGGPEDTWPAVWAQNSGREVINLAIPGATISDVLERQLPKIDSPGATVIIEIGGNDLLGETTAAEYHDQLAELLTQLKKQKHRLVMFELPLLPLTNRFGRSQRTLANSFGVTLIPKRVLVDVFEGKGATLDGLHLTQAGHDELARKVQEITSARP